MRNSVRGKTVDDEMNRTNVWAGKNMFAGTEAKRNYSRYFVDFYVGFGDRAAKTAD